MPYKDPEARRAWQRAYAKSHPRPPRPPRPRKPRTRVYDPSRLPPDHERRKWLQRAYGLSLEQFEVLIGTQNGLCAICGTNLLVLKPRLVHIDHDHTTGVIRGVLCGSCNLGIGNLKDSSTVARAAVEYLVRHGR